MTVGQSLVIAVSDSVSGSVPGGLAYGLCGPNTEAVASGHATVGPLGPAEGGTGWRALSVSCSNGTWNYSGSITVTVPQDAGSSMWVSVAVQEFVPLQSVGCSPVCTSEIDYNFNHTYPVVTSSSVGTSTSSTTTVSSGTTSTGGTSTNTLPATTSAGSTQTITGTTTIAQSTTITVTTGATTPPAPTYVINVPSTITINQAGPFMYITITSGDQRSLQTLCWRAVSTTRQTCLGSRGVWRVKLRKAAGKQVFLLEEHGKVVARKTVSINVKR